MSELEEIAANVSAVARDITGLSQELFRAGQGLRQAASRAAAAARGSENAAAAQQTARALEFAATQCSSAAQQLLAGKSAAEAFVARTVGGGGGGSAGPPSGSGAGLGLSKQLQDIYDSSSFPTSHGDGRFFLAPGDRFRAVAQTMPPAPSGSFLAMVHGTPTTTAVGGAVLSPDDLASLIRADPAYKDGQDVTLFSCSTGAAEGGFAQQLADRLGVRVLAPTSLAWLPPEGNGAPLVTPSKPNGEPMRRADGTGYGRWVWFEPSGKHGG